MEGRTEVIDAARELDGEPGGETALQHTRRPVEPAWDLEGDPGRTVLRRHGRTDAHAEPGRTERTVRCGQLLGGGCTRVRRHREARY